KLKEISIKTAIITDGIPVKQYEKILRLQIDDLIDVVVITDEIGIRKPNPQLFNYFLEKFKVKGHETIYVGDNIIKDIIPAKLNNIHTVYIHRGGKYDIRKTGEKTPENLKPDFEITNLNEIFGIIDELNKRYYLGKAK
ncbi:MAG: HAD family hydrolase, partial [Candidatus Thorarchaeota archaeon]